MKRFVFLPMAMLAVSALAGCHEPFVQLDQGNKSEYPNTNDTFVVVRDSVAWSFLYYWKSPGTPESLPEVDFDLDLVGGMLLSYRNTGGYSVNFTDVESDDATGTATAYVEETVPGPDDFVTQATTKPYVFAKFKAPVGDVYFVKDQSQEADLAVSLTYPGLANQDWANRQFAPGGDIPQPEEAHLDALNAGQCPIDGTILEKADLPSEGTYTDLGNVAHYCPVDGRYWVLHTQGAFIGTISYWWGHFEPGQY